MARHVREGVGEGDGPAWQGHARADQRSESADKLQLHFSQTIRTMAEFQVVVLAGGNGNR